MTSTPPQPPNLSQWVQQLVESYRADRRTHHIDSAFLPNRDRIIQLLALLRQLVFPGFFDSQRLSFASLEYHTGELLTEICQLLYEQTHQALRYEANRHPDPAPSPANEPSEAQAARITAAFLDRLPDIRRLLALDVQAAFDGDPAAVSTDETVFCYPGVYAIFVHRLAHELYNLRVPLIPRIMSEYAHSLTGIDIHPGASIGESFFIDHGTGVVIGETTQIGNRVKIYQGVTLGALSTKGGQAWRGKKRHPTIEDDVTIYGGAIILGGETVIGARSIIGGSVFITQPVPPDSIVSMKAPELKVSSRPVRGRRRLTTIGELPILDFQI